MVLETEDYAKKHARIDKILAEQAKIVSWLQFHKEQEKLIDETDLSVNNWDRQEGRKLTVDKFEALVQKISPFFRFEYVLVDGKRNGYKRLYFGEEPEPILYHDHWMPEYSWFDTREEEIFDPSLLKRSPNPEALGHIDRKDLPKFELKVNADGSVGCEFDPSAPRPGYRRVRKPWNEKKRGWRTVLRRLVEKGTISIEQAEKVAPTECLDRTSWAIMKHSNLESIF